MRPLLENAPNLLAALGIIWNIALFSGGLIFLVYFWSIGFMPEMDVEVSLSLLIVAALTGIFLLGFLALFLLYPGLWFYFHLKDEPSPWARGSWFFFPMAVSLLHIYIFALRMGLEQSGFEPQPYQIALWYLSFLTAIAGVRYLYIGDIWRALAFGWNLFLATFILFWLFITVAPLVNGDQRWAMYGAGAAVLVINTSVVCLPRDGKSLSVFASALVLLLLLYYPTFLPNGVMRLYQFGHFTASSLVLDETGCDIVQFHGLVADRLSTGNATCRFAAASIHSRLGNTLYIGAGKDGKQVCFTIPAKSVLSWQITQSIPTSRSDCSKP